MPTLVGPRSGPEPSDTPDAIVEKQWFVRIGEKEQGPFSSSQLKRLADRGEITQETRVRKGSQGKWVPAARVKGLLKATESSANVQVDVSSCPKCRELLPLGATSCVLCGHDSRIESGDQEDSRHAKMSIQSEPSLGAAAVAYGVAAIVLAAIGLGPAVDENTLGKDTHTIRLYSPDQGQYLEGASGGTYSRGWGVHGGEQVLKHVTTRSRHYRWEEERVCSRGDTIVVEQKPAFPLAVVLLPIALALAVSGVVWARAGAAILASGVLLLIAIFYDPFSSLPLITCAIGASLSGVLVLLESRIGSPLATLFLIAISVSSFLIFFLCAFDAYGVCKIVQGLYGSSSVFRWSSFGISFAVVIVVFVIPSGFLSAAFFRLSKGQGFFPGIGE
ncbi:MAG: DUF4339 domain-containing protein [Planctomycetes bacterium]|nr:DUF4339 domain-containing protein [Planctomycetota bacterium]